MANKKSKQNKFPRILKKGIEDLSGFSMDNVLIHYDSPRPSQLDAYAYAKESETRIVPGQ